MEKTELTVSMEPERLDALRYFLAAKNKRTPQKELQRALEELYEAYVPAETRAYLDARCGRTGTGAAAGVALLDLALAPYREMVSFADIGMEAYQPQK